MQQRSTEIFLKCVGFLFLLHSIETANSVPDLSLIPICGPADPDPGGEDVLIRTIDDELISTSGAERGQSTYRKEHVAALTEIGDKVEISLFENETVLPSRLRCSLRLESCPSCLFRIDYTPPKRFLGLDAIKILSSCMEAPGEPCLDVKFVEDRADLSIESVYSSESLMLRSEHNPIISTSQSIRILVNMWNIEQNSSLNNYLKALFPFTVSTISNEVRISGDSADHLLYQNQSSIGFIESPRYPASYPRTLEKTYILENSDPKGHIRLMFDDFHVHYQSELRIHDSDGMEVFNTRRDNRRPPAMVSKGNKLTIHFDARDFTQMVGFRARYEFVEVQNWPEKPNARECDEYFENYGGSITLMGKGHLQNTYIDCIWIVGRFPPTGRIFDRMYVKVEDFSIKGVGLRLEIREGPSSTSDRVLLLFDSQTRDQLEHKQPAHGFVTSSTSPSYYIRLRGYLMNSNGLEIVYSQFYRWATPQCPGAGEWHCDNARCIKASLRCDGIDHCGDGSDELCQRPDPNEFSSHHSDISGLIALLIGIVALVILLISSTAIVTRCYRRKLLGRLRQAASSPGASYPPEVAPSIQTVGERRFYVVPERNISVIEAPPCYDDALKHPMVPTGRSPTAYTNTAFSREDPPPFETLEDVESAVINEETPSIISTCSDNIVPEEAGSSCPPPQDAPDLALKSIINNSQSKTPATPSKSSPSDGKNEETSQNTPGSWV